MESEAPREGTEGPAGGAGSASPAEGSASTGDSVLLDDATAAARESDALRLQRVQTVEELQAMGLSEGQAKYAQMMQRQALHMQRLSELSLEAIRQAGDERPVTQGELQRLLESLTPTLDSLAARLHQMEQDYQYWWTWADQKAAPMIRWLWGNDRPEFRVPPALGPLFDLLETWRLQNEGEWRMGDLPMTDEEAAALGAIDAAELRPEQIGELLHFHAGLLEQLRGWQRHMEQWHREAQGTLRTATEALQAVSERQDRQGQAMREVMEVQTLILAALDDHGILSPLPSRRFADPPQS